jgi:hypothetical protein
LLMLLIEYSYSLKPDNTLPNAIPISIPVEAPRALGSNIKDNFSYINNSTRYYHRPTTLYINNIPGLPNNILNIILSPRLCPVTIALY